MASNLKKGLGATSPSISGESDDEESMVQRFMSFLHWFWNSPDEEEAESPPQVLDILSVKDDCERRSMYWNKAFNTLSDEHKNVLESTDSTNLREKFEMLKERTSMVPALQKDRPIMTRAKIWSILRRVDRYINVTNMTISHNLDVAAMLWASIRLTLDMTLDDLKAFDAISTMLEEIAITICSCDTYDCEFFHLDMGADRKLKEEILGWILTIFTACLKFIAEVLIYLRKHTSANFLESKFQPLIGDIRRVKSGLDRLVMDAQHPAIPKVIEEKKRQKILRWLSPVKPVDHHFHACRNRAKGSGEWLFEKPDFQHWIESQHSSVLWLYGKAGSGKTVLCSTVIDTLLATYPHYPVLYFYCNYKEESRQEFYSIIGTLYRDLAALAGVRLDSNLEKEYDTWKLSGERSSGLHINRIKELFSTEALKHDLIFLVIDALDECNKDRLELVEYLKNGIVQCIGKTIQVKLFLTSRHDSGIQTVLKSGLTYEISATDTSKDIRPFVERRLNDMIEKGKLLSGHVTTDLQREIIEVINNKAGGMFLWVDFQLVAICESASIADVRRQLHKLPRDMDETYARMLAKIDEKPDHLRELAYRTLMWIFGAKEPLSPEQLVQATAVEIGSKTICGDDLVSSVQYLVDLCCHTVIIDKSTNRVRFVHFSVQEFLTSHPKFQSVHQYLGPTCLTVMGIGAKMQSEEMIKSFYKYAKGTWWHFVKGIDQIPYNSVISLLRRIPYDGFSISFPSYLPAVISYRYWKEGTITGDHDTSGTDADLPYYLKCVMAYYDFASTLKHELEVSKADASDLAELLIVAIERQNLNTIRVLLENGCDVNYDFGNTNPEGMLANALQVAAWIGKQEIVQMLLSAGAEVNAQGGYYGNALQATSIQGGKEIAHMLLNAGADVNAQGGYRGNALQAAAWMEKQEIVQMLLSAGAEVNAQGGYHGSALHAASIQGGKEIVHMLLNAGAEVNAQGGKYGDALQAASRQGKEEIVQMLLNAGAEYQC